MKRRKEKKEERNDENKPPLRIEQIDFKELKSNKIRDGFKGPITALSRNLWVSRWRAPAQVTSHD